MKESSIILYEMGQGRLRVDVLVRDETVWLTQKALAELFGKERSVITKHLKNIFGTGELDEKSNVQKMHISGSEQKAELDRRLDAYHRNPDEGSPWEVVRERIRRGR